MPTTKLSSILNVRDFLLESTEITTQVDELLSIANRLSEVRVHYALVTNTQCIHSNVIVASITPQHIER